MTRTSRSAVRDGRLTEAPGALGASLVYADPAATPRAARVGITPRSLGAYARLARHPEQKRTGLPLRLVRAASASARGAWRRLTGAGASAND